MNILKITAAVTAFLLAVLASSCVKEEIDLDNISEKIYWNPTLGLPVAYGNLSLKDLIEEIDSEQMIKEDDNQFLTLIYSDTVFSTNAGSILTFNNQTFGESMLASQYSLPSSPSEATITMSRTNDYPFSFSHGEIIDIINLKTGTMVINMSSTFRHTGTLKITVPKLVKNNTPFETTINIDKADGTFATTQSLDISGYELQIDHPNETDNLVKFEYLATLTNSGAGIIAGHNVTISVGLNNLSFTSLNGYIGHRQLLNTLSQFSIPFFKNVSNPNLALKNPSLKLRTTNSFGLPASIELYNAEAVNDKDSKSIPITFSTGTNPFYIAYPPAIGLSAKDTVVFDNTVTNLYDAFKIAPNKINYGIRAFSNPDGRIADKPNYITEASNLLVELDVEIPLELHSSRIEFTDTMDLDLSDIPDPEEIKFLLLHSSFNNGMPVDLDLQIYMLDENYAYVDTLFGAGVDTSIKSGELDQNGKVIKSTKKDLDVQYTQSEIKKLQSVRYAIVRAGVSTKDYDKSTFVKFYSNYTINVHFAVQTELEINE